ncbi:hypothetical protein TUN199_12303, partial [Pyrenophora tritici-repentis]
MHVLKVVATALLYFSSLSTAQSRLAISQVTQFELTELTAKTQFSQSVLEAAG